MNNKFVTTAATAVTSGAVVGAVCESLIYGVIVTTTVVIVGTFMFFMVSKR